MDWKKISKIDAHVHLLPPERLADFKRDDPDCWGHADAHEYCKLMEAYGVEKAILVPINEPYTYFEDPERTNQWLGSLVSEYPGRFVAFADVLNNGGYFSEFAPEWLSNAATQYGAKGLKLHPSNLGINVDSLDMVPVVRKAADLKLPIMIHSYPYCRTAYDCCEPARIHNLARVFPDATFIISHMGGHRWADVLAGEEYVDISTFLPELVRLYDIPQANRVLRSIGVGRLIFATDFPQVYLVKPENIYETYCDILNQMDFTQAEAEQIAYGNIAKVLGLE